MMQAMREMADWHAGTEVAELQQKEATLLSRLRRGEEKIAAARDRGENVGRWEDLWIEILREYEQTYDRLTLATSDR